MLGSERPRFVGLSILWEGQVLAAMAVSILAKRRWPGVPVVWGGAHVTALAPEIVEDSRYGWRVDGFVAGYAEGTFRSMLRGEPLAAPGVFRAGQPSAAQAVEELDSIPQFHDVHLYGRPRLTLPTQTARGCAYGRCAFCTYPAVEGGFRLLDADAVTMAVERSVALGAELAMRDAFATPARLALLSGLVAGRTRFAATTRLVPRLGRARLKGMVRAGLHTLELGVEAVDREVLRLVAKRQAPEAVEGWLEDAAGLDLHLVLNVMFGYPGQSAAEAKATRSHFDVALRRRFPRTRFTVERNLLQLERRSPMAAEPTAFGITVLNSAPWSSVLSWDAPSWRPAFDLQTPLIERLRSA